MGKPVEQVNTLEKDEPYNTYIPIIIFCISVIGAFFLVMDILPVYLTLRGVDESAAGLIVPFLFSINIGVLSLNLYYLEWRQYRNITNDLVGSKLLNTAIAWLAHNVIIIVVLMTGSYSGTHQSLLFIYIPLLIALYFWGSWNLRLGRYLTDDSPAFIRLAVFLSQAVYAISILPTFFVLGLFVYVSALCACD